MSTKQNQKSEKWAEIKNFFQDERRDYANGVALQWVSWTLAIESLFLGFYLLSTQATFQYSLFFLIIGFALTGWFGWQHYRFGDDERAEHLVRQQYLKITPFLLAAALFIFSIAGFLATPNLFWLVLIAVPGIVGIYMQLMQKIVPWHLALLIFLILSLVTVASYLFAIGFL